MASDKVQWIQVVTGSYHFMNVSLSEVERKLDAIGFKIIDAHELKDLKDKLQSVKNAAAILADGERLDVGLTDEELNTTFDKDDLREEYREIRAAFRRVQEVLRG